MNFELKNGWNVQKSQIAAKLDKLAPKLGKILNIDQFSEKKTGIWKILFMKNPEFEKSWTWKILNLKNVLRLMSFLMKNPEFEKSWTWKILNLKNVLRLMSFLMILLPLYT